MVYAKYGAAFRELRVQHGLSLSDFNAIGIAKSTLSNFENGKNMIAFDKLGMALQEMRCSLLDYSLVINNGEQDDFVELFHNINEGFWSKDTARLQAIYDECISEDVKGESWMIAISAKACYTELCPQEIKRIVNFLNSVSAWGIYEMSVFVNTLHFLDIRFVLEILTQFWDNRKYYMSIPEYRLLIMRCLVRTCRSLIELEMRSEAKLIIERGRSAFVTEDAANRIMFKFIEGCVQYKFEGRKNGLKQAERMLEIFKEIGADGLYRVFKEDYYDKLLVE